MNNKRYYIRFKYTKESTNDREYIGKLYMDEIDYKRSHNPFMAVTHYIEDNNINPNRVWGHNKMYDSSNKV
jgi:hypothetical protein